MVKKVLKEFNVEYLQILDENGSCDEALMPKLSNDEIKKIYEMLVLTRVFDQKAFNMQREGRLGTYIQFKGQEACQVGSALALKVFFFQAEDGIRDCSVTGVQTCALPI